MTPCEARSASENIPAGTEPRGAGRSVAADESGAIMVIGVFMAMLVVGFLYYVVGIGNTLIYRERLQDAADSIAFSGAAIHARGMNLVAMINIILALLTTIWMTMKLIQVALLGLIVACVFFCAPAIPALESAERALDNVITIYSRTILSPALTLGHTAEESIRTAFPILAYAYGTSAAFTGSYSPPASAGVFLPLVPRALPLKPMPMRDFCVDHAAPPVASALTYPLSLIPFLSPVRSLIAGWISRVIGTVFCPDDRASQRPYDIDPGDGSCTDGMPGQNCEYTQLRAVASAGTNPFARNTAGVGVAAWGRGVGSGGGLGAMEELTRFSFAQAEYYYDGEEERGEWAWHMYWRARFRRVRLAGAASSIPGLSTAASLIDRIIVH